LLRKKFINPLLFSLNRTIVLWNLRKKRRRIMAIAVGNYLYPQPQRNSKAELNTFEQVAGIQGTGIGVLRTGQALERAGVVYNNALVASGRPRNEWVGNFAGKMGGMWRCLSLARAPGAILDAVEAHDRFRNASVICPGFPGVSQACTTGQKIDLGIDAAASSADAMAMMMYSGATVASCSKATAVAVAPLLATADALVLGKDGADLYFSAKEAIKAGQAEKTLVAEGAPKETVLAFQQTKIYGVLKTIKAISSVVSGVLGMGILLGVIAVNALALAILSLAVTSFAITAMIYREKMKYKPVNVLTGGFDTSRLTPAVRQKLAAASA
jgi:hypothetical protein